jgi:hypothetical protein
MMAILGIGEPVVRVGQMVLYQNSSGVECPAIVTVIYPLPVASKAVPKEPATVDLTVFSANPGATSYLTNINFGSGPNSYHFMK